MKKGFKITLFFIASFICINLHAQTDTIQIVHDTISHDKATLSFAKDTLSPKERKQIEKQLDLKLVKEFQPDPTKAVIYSAIFPGLGQIYNKKYWKLPIVYGGFLGVVYAVTWNGNMYGGYKDAYKDIMTDPYNKTRWHEYTSQSPETILSSQPEMTKTKELLKRRRDYFRRNRDLAIIVGVGLYALCMIDAYVDAHLYNFTVTPDLSMTVSPIIWGPSDFSGSASIGFQCNIVF